MIDRSAQGPASDAQKSWRWWHIIIAILGGLVLLPLIVGDSVDLKVSIPAGSGASQLHLLNVGRKAIEITGVKINERDDCQVRTLFTLSEADPKIWPIPLDVGGGLVLFNFCRVVRATVKTKFGSASYEFK